MIVEVDGTEIVIIDTDDRMVFHMAYGRGYETETLTAWARMVQPGKVALDVGAYTGLFSIIAAKRGATAIALEPMPANRWRLECNAAANKVAVMLLDVAASDDNGVGTLHFNPNVPLTTGASLENGNAQHRDSIVVRRVTIDALALNNLCAIKIDVERHEPCVLRGAMQTIERDRPSLLIETLDDNMRNEAMRLLPSYEIAAILDGRNTLFIPK
ncbi:FkbM family methyltransferase [Bradyrhizobium sp. BRP22]|uniref:FkbM family methyltransferase n=1 Tax=Bradyrhizobium sp. BRP22 TaxID=2793821 RepID=UPI001CD1DA38|nr:FkbM family methyltransferase [Bradyrhizobium sp. BRP22]MCA1452837.1 FkbM family methyltransferase [Bradyrhizobium sp. BRP22]